MAGKLVLLVMNLGCINQPRVRSGKLQRMMKFIPIRVLHAVEKKDDSFIMGCVVFCFVVRISVYVAKQKEQQLAVTCLDLRCLVFFFRTHPRLNLGCVLVFLLVCLCAHLRLNLGCVVFVFVRIPVSTWGA